ncbi:MAG: MBL fold metallo-hydrolase [Clostridia bacterium]|nr:MBL fold metallo-hydrolase [Clostridia bacterium]
MNKNRVKKIATWIIVPLMAAIFLLDIATVAIGNSYCRRFTVTQEDFDYSDGDDRIHFLNTANSDSILIESNGLYALIDAGEGNSNPRRKTAYKGYEQEVIDYIKKVCKKDDGSVYLDFIMGTHCHYDHIGSYLSLISDSDIGIGKAYFKEFNKNIAKDYETERWKIDKVYQDIIDALNGRSIEIVSDLSEEEFVFGDFTLRFVNTVTPEEFEGKGENASSIGVIVCKGSKTAFLAADITESTGLEDVVAPVVGDVDLLKIGHHGYYGSSSKSFLKALSPEIAIVTNQLGKVYPNVKWNLTMFAKVPFYATYDNNGIIATFTDDEIILTNNIH